MDRQRFPSADADAVRWVRSYLFAAEGSFARAERLARSALAAAADPALEARAAVTLGSILRQTARHAEARDVETRALRHVSDEEYRAHLRIGLAADHVGLADLRGADRQLGRVAVRRDLGWRVAVRLRWVRCERELLAGEPARAVAWARRARAISRSAGAMRHEAKSLLFVGAAAMEAAVGASGARRRKALEEADRSLRRARSVAARIGARPIERVAGELLRRR